MSFERNAPKAPATAKKAVLMVLCGVALASVLGYNWLSNSPRSASGAPVLPNSAVSALMPAGMVEETPAQAIAKLTNDPTANLLRGRDDQSTELDASPANPFVLAPTWRASLMKTAVVPHAAAPDSDLTHISAPATPVHAKPGELNLQAIVKEPQTSFAIVNGHIVVAGMIIEGVRIMEISGQHIVCQPIGDTESGRFELTLKPKVKQ